MVRVATFNVQHGRRPDGLVDVDLLAEVCASLDADVLALQEVDRFAARSARAHIAARVAARCGLAVVFAPAHRLGLVGRYGNALLVRGTMRDVTRLSLPRPSRRHERRAAIVAEGDVAGVRLSVAATHLGRDRAESHAQLAVVLDALGRRPLPRLLLGDLNRRAGEVDLLRAAGYLVAGGPPTYPAGQPDLRIDHVAVQGLGLGVVDAPPVAVSDHRPLVVEVQPYRDEQHPRNGRRPGTRGTGASD